LGRRRDVDLSRAIPGVSWDTIAQGNWEITGLAATADAIYFSEPGDPNMKPANGLIERAPLAPGRTFVLLARQQSNPRSLAVDATRVYWSTDDCAIRATRF
jgi:hypothetical protein